LIAGLIAVFGVVYFLALNYLSAGALSPIENFIGFLYSIFDFALLISIVILIYVVMNGNLKVGWTLICIAVFITWIADILYYVFFSDAPSGSWVDLPYAISYLFFAAGFIELKANAEHALNLLKQNIEIKKVDKESKSKKK
jgi:hypothetical protein